MRYAITVAMLACLVPAAASAQKVGATRQQVLDHAATQFKKLDADGNGQLTSAEITTTLQARATASGKTFRPKLANRMMKTSDANGDGTVTLEEFQNAAGSRFDQLDGNKNGKIDDGEQGKGGAG